MNIASLKEFTRYTPDELSELYKRNPERFDELAAAAIHEACIGKSPEQTIRLRQIQWSIDGQLRKAKTPLQRMQIMESIFYGRVFGEDGELSKLMYGWKEMLDSIGGLYGISDRKPALHLLKNNGGGRGGFTGTT
ncbi:DUF3135 domain-containing protein [Geobacter sp. SVR]|uniref:DUF3135 domain-containing protein n=1 Tax=Geobacter sp. SVR TaxID=2495594 RepID=UPI00143EFA14|nr:DUF3135 domain-containing protein [Geobacter sp. SVR]BCS55374.1 hypothetical protein GSVR_36820 [Geobacter sp. SVR]GCF87297.1 hypothetical protein GSbR_38970 [Geobacter sp. SVR]